MESKIPPLPGIICPESFVADDRLITDSSKSPKIEKTAVKKEIISILDRLPDNIEGNNTLNKIPIHMEDNNPPIKPAKLLFGLALINPLFFLPNIIPKTQAQESHPKTKIRKRHRNSFEKESVVIFDKKEIKKPI